MYSTVQDCVKIVIGNKVDKAATGRKVSQEEGMNFARSNGCLFLECSAKTKVTVRVAPRSTAVTLYPNPLPPALLIIYP